MDNLKPLKMKFMAKSVPYDVLLCYNREIYTARGDDNNMAISTVSSYKQLDYVRPCVGALYSFRWTSTTVLCSRQFLQGVFKAEKEEVDIFVLRVVIYCVHRVYFELISLICVYRSKIT